MSDIRNWSATDASNTATPPDGFPEGMQAGKLNDSGRAVMGAVRRFAEDVPWFDFGDTITRSSSSSLLIHKKRNRRNRAAALPCHRGIGALQPWL